MKVCTKGGIQKIQSVTLEITGLHEILGQDYGIERMGTLVLYRSTIHFSNLFIFKAMYLKNSPQSTFVFKSMFYTQSSVCGPQSTVHVLY